MTGVYRPRHPERAVLYRVLFHYFDRFLAEYEGRFEKEYGFFRPIVKEVVERYLDCGNPRCGFARIRCPDCQAEHLLMFSCRTRGVCPSCHAKRLEEWGEGMRETLLLDGPHRPGVFTPSPILWGPVAECMRPGVFHKIPRIDDARLASLFAREVLADLVRKELLSPEWAQRLLSWRHTGFHVHSRVRAKTKKEAERVGKYMIRPLLSLERLSLDEGEALVGYRHGNDAQEVEHMDYLEFIARVTSHIPDKGQVTVRYYGLYANAHRGKVKKASRQAFPLRLVEDQTRPVPSKAWAQVIRKVYEADPMVCPQCGGQMGVIS